MESDKASHISFRRTFAWVVAAHLAVIFGISVWSWVTPGAPTPLKFISMVNAGDLVRGLPGPSTGPQVGAHPTPAMEQPAPAPVTQPPALAPQELTYQQPEPQPQPQPVEPTPVPTPTPAPETSEPTLRPEKPVAVKPVVKPRPQVKVNLQEVTRADSDATPAAATSHHASKTPPRLMADASDTAISSLAVAEKLGASLRSSGVTSAVVSGKSGRRDGTDSEAGRYYTLIRDQMYEAWDRPLSLLGKGLCTQVRITIEKSGAIAGVELKHSSGNAQHDETAMAAVRKVGRIAEPLPEGVDASVDINFKLTN